MNRGRGKPTAPAVMLTATLPIGMNRAERMSTVPRWARARRAQARLALPRLPWKMRSRSMGTLLPIV